MNHPPALARLIKQCEKNLMQKSCQDSIENSMIFTSVQYESLPSLICKDPLLRPIDKMVFYNIWIFGKEHGQQQMAFPSYDYLCHVCNVARGTIATAIKKLRVYGLLSLVKRVRDAEGKHRGNIYIINPEPLSIAKSLEYDPAYIQYLEKTAKDQKSCQHLAQLALARLKNQPQDPYIKNNDEELEQRLQTQQDIRSQRNKMRIFGINATRVPILPPRAQPFIHRVQNLNSVKSPVQNLNSVKNEANTHQNPSSKIELGSNFERVQNLDWVVVVNNKLNTTTSSSNEIEFQNLKWGSQVKEVQQSLSLTLKKFCQQPLPDDCDFAKSYQLDNATSWCQFLLDELEQAITNKAGSKYPVKNPNNYLHGIINKIKEQEYTPNGGHDNAIKARQWAATARQREEYIEQQSVYAHIRRMAQCGLDLTAFGYTQEQIRAAMAAAPKPQPHAPHEMRRI